METSRVCERTSCEESKHIVYICKYTPYRAATVLPGFCRIEPEEGVLKIAILIGK